MKDVDLAVKVRSEPVEPVLRPSASRGPALSIVRTARLFREQDSLVLRLRSGREKRLPIGGTSGIATAVYVTEFGPGVSGGMGNPPVRERGVLRLEDTTGQTLAYFHPDEWLPEEAAIRHEALAASVLLRRTGISALLSSAHIPLEMRNVPAPGPLRQLGRMVRGLFDRKHWAPGAPFPLWYLIVRTMAFAAWFTFFSVTLFSGAIAPWTVIVSGIAIVTAPLARIVLRCESAWKNWRTNPAYEFNVSPSPAPGSGATVRFCQRAALRTTDSDLILRDFAGRECWLPRHGPNAVTKIVLVSSPSDDPLGVELVGRDGHVRERLTWVWWFGGSHGEANWKGFKGALGLNSTKRRMASSGGHWNDLRVATNGDELRLSPSSAARDARRASRFPRTIVRTSSMLVFLSAITLFGQTFGNEGKFSSAAMLEGHQEAKTFVLCCVVGTVTLMALPYLVHQVLSRLWLERPASDEQKGRR